MLARGNGDGAERTSGGEWEEGGWEERQYLRVERRERGARFLPLMVERGASRRAWLKRGPRRRRQRPRPCCIYHIITIIELRAAHSSASADQSHPRSPFSYHSPQPQIGNSRIHFPFVARSKLFAVGRRPSSRKDANDSSANTQSWNACSARGWSTYGH